MDDGLSDDIELPDLATIIDVAALTGEEVDVPVNPSRPLMLDIPVSPNRHVLLEVPSLSQDLANMDTSSASLALPDTTSYSVIMDQSLSGLGDADLTATESMILPSVPSRAMFALEKKAGKEPASEPIKPRSVTPQDSRFATPPAKSCMRNPSRSPSPTRGVRFQLTVTEVSFWKLLCAHRRLIHLDFEMALTALD